MFLPSVCELHGGGEGGGGLKFNVKFNANLALHLSHYFSTKLAKRAAKTEQATVRRFFSEVALRWLAHYGGGGGVVTGSLPKAPPWHPQVML